MQYLPKVAQQIEGESRYHAYVESVPTAEREARDEAIVPSASLLPVRLISYCSVGIASIPRMRIAYEVQ